MKILKKKGKAEEFAYAMGSQGAYSGFSQNDVISYYENIISRSQLSPSKSNPYTASTQNSYLEKPPKKVMAQSQINDIVDSIK